MRRIAIAFIGCLVASEAAGQMLLPELPIQDVDRACARLSPGTAVAACIRSEQQAYDYAKSLWPLLNPSRRAFCIEQSKAQAGGPSYYLVLSAHAHAQATAEQIQREQNTTPHFRP